MEYDRWYSLDWSEPIRFYGFILVCYSSLIILLTYAVLKLIFFRRKNYPNNLKEVPFTNVKVNVDFIQLVLLLLSLFGFVYIFLNSPSWPMLDAILGRNDEALSGRISFRNDFNGSDFIKNLIAFSSSALYFYISLSRRLIHSDGIIHFFLSLMLVILIYTYNSQKGAILNISIGALIIYCMVRGFISIRNFCILIFLGVLSILTLFSLVKGIPLSYLIDSGGKLIIGRLFLGNIEGFFNSLELFPHVIDDKTGLVGLPSIFQEALTGSTQEPSKLLLMKYFDLNGVQNGTSGFITSYFMAEAWANYNILGVLLAPISIAINIFLVDYVIYKKGKNILTLTFYAVMYLQFQLHGEFVGFLYFKYFLYFLVSIAPLLLIYLVFSGSKIIKGYKIANLDNNPHV